MANRLAHETSPYLLQHRDNPVDWYPWGEEALERARDEDRPILLSVGYSACHWCHVMERESFEDPAVAELMNRWFVCVKVDREERPDLDGLYMQAVQAFSGGHGGWPMTVFLTPDGRPFFGGTYYPPEPRHGMPSFSQVLQHVHGVWERERDKALEVGDLLRERIASAGRLPAGESALRDDWLATIATAAHAAYDERIPAWGPAPRFPRPWTIRILLAHRRRSGWARSLEMATGVLDAMARGGMYDILGGGFARYSVDEAWRIPHFEKMLYDNAQLVPCYLEGWLVTGRERYRRIARETLDFVLAELRDPAGGFHSALDADSEGEEGLFYTWTPEELREALGEDDAAWLAEREQVTEAGTFEHGRSVLRPVRWEEELSEEDRARLHAAHETLRQVRAHRVRPGLDDKVLTAWNGLMIGAFARAGAVLREERYLAAAREAAAFALDALRIDGRLMRTWKGEARVPAFLDDHADLLDGLIELWCASGERRFIEAAIDLADATLELFWDEDAGGFFQVGRDGEELLARSKPLLGSAEPSGNGMAAWALVRLAALTGERRYEERATRVLRSLQQLVDRAPLALGPEALAAAWLTGPVFEVGLVGDCDELEAALHADYEPFRVVARMRDLDAPIPWMAERLDAEGALAYVCSRGACQLPAGTPEALAEQLALLAAPSEEEPAPIERPIAPPLPSDPELWLGAEDLDLRQLRGNVVVLDFWTYCCINCLHVLPELAALEEAFFDQPLVVIGVHSAKFPAERERDNVARALARHRVRHPVLLDGEHAVWKAFGVRSWPTVAVLDAEGRLAWARPGEVRREELVEVVGGLLDEAREAGTLGQPARRPAEPAPDERALSHPGKVQAWPDEAAQAMGIPPYGPDTRLYLADSGHHRVLELTVSRGADGWPEARLTRSFGSGLSGLLDGPARLARFRDPQGMARDGDALWVADTGNHAVRRIDLESGEVSTAVGSGELGRGHGGDPDQPRELALRSPWDLVAVNGMLWIAMAGSHQVWVHLPEAGRAGPFAGSGREDHVDGAFAEAAFAQPSGLCLVGPWLFVADSEVSSVRALDLQNRRVATLVGAGLFDFGDVDGVGEEVRLQHALGVSAAGGIVYVADTLNGKVKRIDPRTRACSTLAAGLSEPGGITALGDHLIVADTNAHRLVAVHTETGELRAIEVGGL